MYFFCFFFFFNDITFFNLTVSTYLYEVNLNLPMVFFFNFNMTSAIDYYCSNCIRLFYLIV